MKIIKFTILAFLLGCGICSLNAQMEIFPDGSMHVGNTATSHAKISVFSNMVQIGNTAAPNMAIKANPDGSLHFGHIYVPTLKVEPNGSVSIGKPFSEIKAGSDGIIHFGNATTPQIKVNPTERIIRIGETGKPLFDTDTRFQVDVLKAVIKYNYEGADRGNAIDDIGFQFIRSIDRIPAIKPLLGVKKEVMALTGLSDGKASIGTVDNNIHVIYSKYLYSNGNYLGVITNSDFNLKTNIRELAPISEKILKLRPVSYDFVKTSSGEDVSENSAYKNRTGFIAQEVSEIFPDLVAIGENNIYSLDYTGLIPYLTKAFQEHTQIIQGQIETIRKQDQKIEDLQKQINEIQSGVYAADFTIFGEENDEDTPRKSKSHQINETGNVLYQNTPNPFNISTTIKYQLSYNVTNAKICIYNLTGKQLQCYNLQTSKGESYIEIHASSLQSGMYLYSLIVDDKLIDTKRMILTE